MTVLPDPLPPHPESAKSSTQLLNTIFSLMNVLTGFSDHRNVEPFSIHRLASTLMAAELARTGAFQRVAIMLKIFRGGNAALR